MKNDDETKRFMKAAKVKDSSLTLVNFKDLRSLIVKV